MSQESFGAEKENSPRFVSIGRQGERHKQMFLRWQTGWVGQKPEAREDWGRGFGEGERTRKELVDLHPA